MGGWVVLGWMGLLSEWRGLPVAYSLTGPLLCAPPHGMLAAPSGFMLAGCLSAGWHKERPTCGRSHPNVCVAAAFAARRRRVWQPPPHLQALAVPVAQAAGRPRQRTFGRWGAVGSWCSSLVFGLIQALVAAKQAPAVACRRTLVAVRPVLLPMFLACTGFHSVTPNRAKPRRVRRLLHDAVSRLCLPSLCAAAFEACRGLTHWDQPLMLYLLPFMMVEAAGQGGAGLQLVAQEIQAVMQVRPAAGTPYPARHSAEPAQLRAVALVLADPLSGVALLAGMLQPHSAAGMRLPACAWGRLLTLLCTWLASACDCPSCSVLPAATMARTLVCSSQT